LSDHCHCKWRDEDPGQQRSKSAIHHSFPAMKTGMDMLMAASVENGKGEDAALDAPAGETERMPYREVEFVMNDRSMAGR